MAIVTTTVVHNGPWRHPIFTAGSRRLYEPGFLAARLPWLRSILRRVNAGPLFIALGMLPLENELGTRQIAALAWMSQRRHGPLLLSEIFEERVAGMFAPGTMSSDLWRRELFRQVANRGEALDAARAVPARDARRDARGRRTRSRVNGGRGSARRYVLLDPGGAILDRRPHRRDARSDRASRSAREDLPCGR